MLSADGPTEPATSNLKVEGLVVPMPTFPSTINPFVGAAPDVSVYAVDPMATEPRTLSFPLVGTVVPIPTFVPSSNMVDVEVK